MRNDSSETQEGKVFVGIDVAKDTLAVFVSSTGEHLEFTNDSKGHRKLIAVCKTLMPEKICLEATGGYQTKLMLALTKHKLAVSMVNPRRVRYFAKGLGLLAKTDKIDAEVLSRYAEVVKPEVTVMPDEEHRTLTALIRRRDQLIDMLTAETNRRALAPAPVQKGLRKHIKWLEKQRSDIEKEIRQTMKQSSMWDDAKLLETLPGVSVVSSSAILAELPEIGKVSNKRIAAICGVAPFTRQSGKWKGQEKIQGGRKRVRDKLYMAAYNSVQYNPVMKEYFDRLIASGKLYKVAMVAVMRKLICLCNSMIKHQTSWDPSKA
jgi:transposase